MSYLRIMTSHIGEALAERPPDDLIVKVGFLADNVIYVEDEDGHKYTLHVMNYVANEDGTLTGYIEDCAVCNETHGTLHSKEVKG